MKKGTIYAGLSRRIKEIKQNLLFLPILKGEKKHCYDQDRKCMRKTFRKWVNKRISFLFLKYDWHKNNICGAQNVDKRLDRKQ